MAETNNTHEAAQQTQYIQRQDDDEISLIELWDILVRRKKILAAVFAIVIIAALGYLMVTKPIYESRAIISVGFIPQNPVFNESENAFETKFVEKPETLMRQIKEKHNVNVETQKTEEGLLILTAQGFSPEEPKIKLLSAIEETLLRINALFDTAARDFDNYTDFLYSQKSELEKQILEYKEKIDSASAKNPSLSAMLVLEKGRALEQKVSIEKQIIMMRFALSPVNTQPSKVLKEPTISEEPVKPKKKLVLALSFVLGIFMGVFAAFFAEFLANVKKMRRERVNQQLQQR